MSTFQRKILSVFPALITLMSVICIAPKRNASGMRQWKNLRTFQKCGEGEFTLGYFGNQCELSGLNIKI